MCSAFVSPNGERYPLVGGMRQRHFSGINFKPRQLPENAQTPTSRVHAVLGNVQCIDNNKKISNEPICIVNNIAETRTCLALTLLVLESKSIVCIQSLKT